jgi:hypothetical protein
VIAPTTSPDRRWSTFGLPMLFVLLSASVVLAWPVFYFGLYIGYGNYEVLGHQEFAANGVAQIEPASQMNQLFGHCRNYITYAGGASTSEWNAVAFFGGRYQLTMQVPVDIESRTKGHATGEPRFYLNEVSAVDISSGRVMASFSRSITFGPAEWNRVLESGGDFSTIGFIVKTGPPAKHFAEFAKSSR